ncbi:alpha-(1,3)-fucosyltransferase 4-like [Gouania willdenowi]|uniref:Fucosyltransferase n=1 Tax=Gouania willdenowi TaxID=441366 RepID=A0A8C5ED49_GOUWI|nr:alpha-(1,3)-fucosyltransferase 4-like [Gouania willdenowi]
MGAGVRRKPFGLSTSLTAHGNKTDTEWKSDRALNHVLCALCTATICFLTVLGVSVLYLQDTPSPSPSLPPITLLVWVHPFGRFRPLPDCWEQYRIHGCMLTDDKHAYRQADAVIFHHRDISTGDIPMPPEPRPRSQKWIWMNHESPSHSPGLWRFDGVFNLTLTYRTDSNIYLPYGYLIPRVNSARSLYRATSLRRPVRLLAWVISNWSESHARVSFYHKLRRHVNIDVYGRAGMPLPEGSEAVLGLLRQYMFYLALENSQHTDYITEKVWNAVRAGAIPVVLGPSRQNYERFLPPEAFIHVDDFPTVRELARYMHRLKRRPALTKRHLIWRQSYSIHQPTFWSEHYCTACKVLRRTRGQTSEVHRLQDWFYS